jgi:hypothetical protein
MVEYTQRGEHYRGTLVDRFGGSWKNVERRYRNWLREHYPAVERAMLGDGGGGEVVRTEVLVRMAMRK